MYAHMYVCMHACVYVAITDVSTSSAIIKWQWPGTSAGGRPLGPAVLRIRRRLAESVGGLSQPEADGSRM